MPPKNFFIRICNWDEAQSEAQRIRQLVFVREQGVPPELEMDEWDRRCDHALAYGADGAPVGTGRLLPDGHIGRMAVLKDSRGQGAGGALLLALLEEARKRGHACARLNAQVGAIGFYRRHGFDAEGSQFIEAGIPHIAMQRRLKPDPD